MNRLKDLREDHDLEQKDVAKILGISQQYYSRYEIGAVDLPIRHYIKLAQYYNVSIDYIAGVVDTVKPLEDKTTPRMLSMKENNLIKAYNQHPEYQASIDKLLEL